MIGEQVEYKIRLREGGWMDRVGEMKKREVKPAELKCRTGPDRHLGWLFRRFCKSWE